MNFPDRLKKLRKDKGLTQDELAKAIFVSRTLITKYENGSVYPTKQNAEKLALYFNISLAELIDNDDAVQLVLKHNDISSKINYVLEVVIVAITAIFSILCLIPFLKISGYDYSNGTPPTIKTSIVSPIHLTMNNGNPIAIITVIMLLVNCVLASICLINRKNIWLKVTNYVLFVINLFLIFFTIVFIVIYCSNNSFDFM